MKCQESLDLPDRLFEVNRTRTQMTRRIFDKTRVARGLRQQAKSEERKPGKVLGYKHRSKERT